jgi:hypothetical protein
MPKRDLEHQNDRYSNRVGITLTDCLQRDSLPSLKNGNEEIENSDSIDDSQPTSWNRSTSGWDDSVARRWNCASG